MKKVLVLIVGIAIGLGLGYQMEAVAGSGIVGSAHDLVGKEGVPTNTPICEVCHIPHNAKSSTVLWNHALTTANYQNNLNTVFNTTWGVPSGTSLLCLSCHDGTVAVENFGNVTNGTHYITGGDRIGSGTSLSGNHPISVSYPGPNAPISEFKAVADAKGAGIRFYGTSGSEKIECGSCHDVHNKATVEGKLLRVGYKTAPGTGNLCLACHNK